MRMTGLPGRCQSYRFETSNYATDVAESDDLMSQCRFNAAATAQES